MNVLTSLGFLLLVGQALPASAAPKMIQGSFEMVVCMREGNLNVRGDNLSRILFSVSNYETLKIFQGWGENKKSKYIDGRNYSFVKVQFPRREDRGQASIGWVAEQLIKPKSECAGASSNPAGGGNSSDDSEQDPVAGAAQRAQGFRRKIGRAHV